MSNELSAAILRQVLTLVKDNNGYFADEHGELLATICTNDTEMTLLQAASEIVEKGRVTRVEAQESKRSFMRITSNSHHRSSGGMSFYTCFPHYCSCANFLQTTVHGKSTMCKHILASLLAEATGKAKIEYVDDHAYADLLCPVVKE